MRNKLVLKIVMTALLTAIIILFKYVLVLLTSALLLVISAFIAIYYHDKKFMRMFISSLSLFLLSFIYFDILSILIYILPGIIIGNIAHFLLKIILNFPYYISTIPIYFIFHSLTELLYGKFILNLNVIDYFKSGMEFPVRLVENLSLSGLIILFLMFNLLMGIMEAVIIRKGMFFFELIKRKINNKK